MMKIPRHVTSPWFLVKTLERIPPKIINIMSLVVMFMHKYQTSAVRQNGAQTGTKSRWSCFLIQKQNALTSRETQTPSTAAIFLTCSSWILPHPQMLKRYLAPTHNLRGCACQFVRSRNHSVCTHAHITSHSYRIYSIQLHINEWPNINVHTSTGMHIQVLDEHLSFSFCLWVLVD